MVASCSVNFPIRLEGLAAHFEMFVHYEPEVFPGLVFRMRSPKVVLLIFVTGKIVITGAKKVTDIYEAFSNIYGVLQDHRKGDARRLVRPAGAPAAEAAPSALTNGDEAVRHRNSRHDMCFDSPLLTDQRAASVAGTTIAMQPRIVPLTCRARQIRRRLQQLGMRFRGWI